MAGIVRVLTTDGGTHPPEKYAMATAELLTPMGIGAEAGRPDNNGPAALMLRAKIAQALIPHHHKVKHTEIGRLRDKGHDHLASDIDPREHSGDALKAVLDCSKGTPWEAQHASADVQQAMQGEINRMFHSAMREEREHHARKNAGHPKCDAFVEAWHPGSTKQAGV